MSLELLCKRTYDPVYLPASPQLVIFNGVRIVEVCMSVGVHSPHRLIGVFLRSSYLCVYSLLYTMLRTCGFMLPMVSILSPFKCSGLMLLGKVGRPIGCTSGSSSKCYYPLFCTCTPIPWSVQQWRCLVPCRRISYKKHLSYWWNMGNRHTNIP